MNITFLSWYLFATLSKLTSKIKLIVGRSFEFFKIKNLNRLSHLNSNEVQSTQTNFSNRFVQLLNEQNDDGINCLSNLPEKRTFDWHVIDSLILKFMAIIREKHQFIRSIHIISEILRWSSFHSAKNSVNFSSKIIHAPKNAISFK